MGTTVMECPPSQPNSRSTWNGFAASSAASAEVTRRSPNHPAAIPELSPLLSGLSAFSAVRLLVYAELPRKVRPRRQPLGSLQLGELRASTREEALHLLQQGLRALGVDPRAGEHERDVRQVFAIADGPGAAGTRNRRELRRRPLGEIRTRKLHHGPFGSGGAKEIEIGAAHCRGVATFSAMLP